MTEATLTRQQKNVEQEALFLVKSEPEPTTDEIIIRGTDTYAPAEPEAEEDSHEDRVKALFEQEKIDFHTLLDFKIKKELVAQLFKDQPDYIPKGAVNLVDVQEMLSSHITQAIESNSHQANYIDMVSIPKARTRYETPVKDIPGDIAYLVKDIPTLEAREDSYIAMAEYLTDYLPEGDEKLFRLTEEYVLRLLPDARAEAVDILKQQLEEEKRRAELAIKELESTIGILSAELTDARSEVSQRDVQMLDSEMDAHLAQEDHEEEVARLTDTAKKLAA